MIQVTSKMPAPIRPAALVVAATLALASCSGSRESSSAVDSRPAVEVAVQAARVESGPQSFDVGGVVRAHTTATLVSRIFADVQEVRVRPGDRVRAGQVLIRLDARDLQAQQARAEAGLAAAEQAIKAATSGREAAEAGLAMATATHTRVSELRAKNSATPNEFDQATSGLRAAESQAQGAQAMVREAQAGAEAARAALRGASVGVSYAVITAPFDGIVTEKRVEVGNMATPGAPLLIVEDPRSFRLEVQVDESRVAGIDRTHPVDVTFDPQPDQGSVAGAPQAGTITEVARALDPGSHAFLVKIDLPQAANLRSGMFGRARFSGPVRQALTVPESAIVRNGQLTSVFVADRQNRARMRLVQVAGTRDGRAEIAAGLDAGEMVVVQPSPMLVDDTPIRAVNREAAADGRLPGLQEVRR
jgi:membrane fusion protein, multidrug efflux system